VRQERSRAWRGSPGRFLCVLCTCLLGCSAGLGPSAGYAIDDRDVTRLGTKITALADIRALRGPPIAIGVDAELAARLHPGGDAFSQWHVQLAVGASQLPRPHESPLGYEVLLLPGIASTYVHDRPTVRPALGLQLGTPIRVSQGRPAWRADDLVAATVHLVPSVGATWMGGDALSISAALTLRLSFFSAILP